MLKNKIGKCPTCCPTGGAILKATYDDDNKVWQCMNCGVEQPRRVNKSSGEMTPSQQAVVRALEAKGWKVETRMIGRNVFVKGDKDRGSPALNLFSGDKLYGKIGVRGSFELTLMRFGPDVKITDDIGISVYL